MSTFQERSQGLAVDMERSRVPAAAGPFADFLALADAMVELAPSADAVAAATESDKRTERHDHLIAAGIEGVITDEDFAAIVANDDRKHLVGDVLPHAMRAVKRWYVSRPTEAGGGGGTAARLTIVALMGPTGRGKTVAAAWLAARIGGRYVRAEYLRRKYVSNWPADQKEYADILGTRVLIVDDVGTERDAESASSMLDDVVNRRQGLRSGWTVITGNLSLKEGEDGKNEFSRRYGERTVRRIEHRGYFIQVKGEDLRARPKVNKKTKLDHGDGK